MKLRYVVGTLVACGLVFQSGAFGAGTPTSRPVSDKVSGIRDGASSSGSTSSKTRSPIGGLQAQSKDTSSGNIGGGLQPGRTISLPKDEKTYKAGSGSNAISANVKNQRIQEAINKFVQENRPVREPLPGNLDSACKADVEKLLGQYNDCLKNCEDENLATAKKQKQECFSIQDAAEFQNCLLKPVRVKACNPTCQSKKNAYDLAKDKCDKVDCQKDRADLQKLIDQRAETQRLINEAVKADNAKGAYGCKLSDKK